MKDNCKTKKQLIDQLVKLRRQIHELKRSEIAHRRAEEELRQAEEKYRRLTESLSELVYRADPQTFEPTYVNSVIERFYGYTVKQWLDNPKLWENTIHPQDRKRVLAEITEAKRKSKSAVIEYRIIRKDKTLRWVEDHVSWEKDQQGKAVSMNGIMYDITEHKQADEALQKSESKYKTLLENLPQKIFLKDRDSVYISCNANYARDLKIKPNEITGKTDYDFYPKKLAEKYRTDDKNIMKSGTVRDIEEEYIQDGQKVFVHTVKTPIKDENGIDIGILGIFWDITEKKKIQEEMKIKTSAIAGSINGIAFADLEGNLTYVNRSFLKLWRYADMKEVLAKPAVEFWQVKEKASEVIHMLRDKGGWIGELIAKRKDGSLFDVQVATNMIKDGAGRPICMMGSFIDITERKRVEQELKKTSKELAYLSRQIIKVQEQERKRISQELHDEIGQALTAVGFNLEAIKNSLPVDSKSIKEKLTQAGSLINEISDSVSIISSDLRPILLDDLGLVSALRWYKERFSKLANIDVKLQTSEVVEQLSDESKTVLYRAVQETLTNVLKHSKADKVKIQLTPKDKYVELCVEDNGIGFNTRRVLDTENRNVGLGLLGMRERIRLVGGTLDIVSSLGKGTKLLIQIPWC